MRTRSLLSLVIASTALVGAARLDAQPTRDHRQPPPPENPTRDHRRAPPPATTGPTEAPPSPREEKSAARAGFVWIAGRWDWKGKWDWIPGHWERERSGQSWHPGHWDKNGASWTFTEGSWGAGAAQPPVTPPTTTPPTTPPPGEVRDHRPHKPPPAPHTETATMKAGFVWVPGHWDWQNDDWKWIDGHWERERAHKKWRADRWDLQGDAYVHVTGDWIDESAAAEPPPPPTNTGVMPPVPPPGEDHVRDHRRDWKIDRPAVSSYWPNKGKAGTRVVIHGVNFPDNAMVVWGTESIKAAKVTPEKIVFEVPANATSGTIALRREHGRDLIVGPFEVAAIDAEAEAKRIAEEQRKAAEAAWVARQKDLAKDRAAREAAWRQREQELETSREQRRQERVATIRAKFQAAFLADADTQAELTMHAERVAQLGRAREVAEIASNGKLVIRIDVATTRETARHEDRMTSLEQAFRTKGGAP